MQRLIRRFSPLWLGLLALVLVPIAPAAAAPPATCTADLIIFTTSPGTVSSTGQVTHFRDSRVGGQYVSGFLSGYTIAGSQNIALNTTTNRAELQGSFTAVGPGGSLTIRYTGHADFATGTATGHYVSAGGTGRFATFHWEGSISAQLIGPATFHATDSGPCQPAP